jgi:hypothetical protein
MPGALLLVLDCPEAVAVVGDVQAIHDVCGTVQMLAKLFLILRKLFLWI